MKRSSLARRLSASERMFTPKDEPEMFVSIETH